MRVDFTHTKCCSGWMGYSERMPENLINSPYPVRLVSASFFVQCKKHLFNLKNIPTTHPESSFCIFFSSVEGKKGNESGKSWERGKFWEENFTMRAQQIFLVPWTMIKFEFHSTFSVYVDAFGGKQRESYVYEFSFRAKLYTREEISSFLIFTLLWKEIIQE